MNIRRAAIIALVSILVLALVVFGISVYLPTHSEELTKYLVIFGFAIIGVAAVVSGWKDLSEFIAKLLGKNTVGSTSSPQGISRFGITYQRIAVNRDLTGTTITGDIHGNVIIGSSPPPPDQSIAGLSTLHTPSLSPNLVHPYALQANFTGRASERKELTAWLSDDAYPICILVAIGGMGKSALAWYWLTQDILKSDIEDRKLDGVMWWSFYEGEASFSKFIDEALKYVTGKAIDAARLPTTYDRALELRRELQNKCVLFVLDGFERQLRAYARLDAAYQSDDATDPSREARACVEPDAARLLKDIMAGTTRAKVLVTSRLMVSDLEDRAGDSLAGVLYHELKELARDDAIAFMRAQGVTKGTNAEIATACEAYGNHPLSLRLLSGLIARDARIPGDIAATPRHDVHADLVARQHHILEQSYNALPDRERALISRIAAFRSPMTYDALAIFNEFGDEAKFDAALNDLHARGVLQRNTTHNRYDLHPIVRRYCYDRLTDKKRIHNRLRKYFAKISAPDADEVQSIEDLAPVIELYHHTILVGRYNEALDLFHRRLLALRLRFGAYQTQIELLRMLSPDGEDHPPRLLQKTDQGWTLSELANAYGHTGQPRNAERTYYVANMIAKKLGLTKNISRQHVNIAIIQCDLGKLATAEQNLRQSIESFSKSKLEFDEAMGRGELGKLLTLRGAFSESEVELLTAQEVFDRRYESGQRNNSVSVIRAYRAHRAILSGDTSNGLILARESCKWADEVAIKYYPHERDFILAESLLGAALVMEGKDLDSAATHLSEALIRCRRINLVELEPDILLAWARWHRVRGNTQEAQTYSEEALAIADRCEYRLKQADIHNFLARLALDAGNRAAARQHAEIAKERAWCDGPPHCYKPALDEAVRMLKEIGQ